MVDMIWPWMIFLLLLFHMFEKLKLTMDYQSSKYKAKLVLSLGPEEAF